MNLFDKLEKLATIYLAEAQTLNLGESSLSINDLKRMAFNLKNKIEQLIKENKIPHHIYNWTNPGDKLIEALNKMSSGSNLDSNLKSTAMEDYTQNINAFLTEEDRNQFNKLFSNYNVN